jgi:hypothetical protein
MEDDMTKILYASMAITVATIPAASAQNRTFSSCEEARDSYERLTKDKNTLAAFKACKATGVWVGPASGREFKIVK